MPNLNFYVKMEPLERSMAGLPPEVDRDAVRLFFRNCELSFGSSYNQGKLVKMAKTLGWNGPTYRFTLNKLLGAYIWKN